MGSHPAAYQVNDPGKSGVDHAFYQAVAAADRTLVEQLTVPLRSGRAWRVPAVIG